MKLSKYRLDRKRGTIWCPMFGGNCIVKSDPEATALYIRMPKIKVLPSDQILVWGKVWSVKGVQELHDMLRVQIAMLGKVRAVK